MSSSKKDSKRKPSAAKRSLNYDDDKSRVVDLTTPTKKKPKKDLDDYFSSPVAKTTSINSSTPSDSTSAAVAVVTPAEETKKPSKKEETKDEYVPTYLNQNVQFHRKGDSTLDPTTKQVFALVEKHYIIPENCNYENDRKYGPKSGISFEQRAIANYCNNLLESRGGTHVIICTSCATEGHKRDDCPELL